ncbi:hypothetical protein NQZ68_027260 [Dissostichus eleginoides]|nr:hypothetical protein NQZ68_027260 [Dissostichus eleginoides]
MGPIHQEGISDISTLLQINGSLTGPAADMDTHEEKKPDQAQQGKKAGWKAKGIWTHERELLSLVGEYMWERNTSVACRGTEHQGNFLYSVSRAFLRTKELGRHIDYKGEQE